MEDTLSNLPVPELPQNRLHIWNSREQKYDIIDLDTGKKLDVTTFELNPVEYSLLLVDVICSYIRNGKTLAYVSRQEGMPSLDRLYHWLTVHPEFKQRVQAAKKQRTEVYYDLIIETAMSTASKEDVAINKLKIDTLKWAVEKTNPEEYSSGDNNQGKGSASVNITLHTGVLDSKSPSDIIVDEFGNFKGFGDADEIQRSDRERGDQSRVTTVELARDRWATTDAEGGSEDRETEETKF